MPLDHLLRHSVAVHYGGPDVRLYPGAHGLRASTARNASMVLLDMQSATRNCSAPPQPAVSSQPGVPSNSAPMTASAESAPRNWTSYPAPAESTSQSSSLSFHGRATAASMQMNTHPDSQIAGTWLSRDLFVPGNAHPRAPAAANEARNSTYSFVRSDGLYNVVPSRHRTVRPEDLSVLGKWSLASHLVDGAAASLCCALYRNELLALMRRRYQVHLDNEIASVEEKNKNNAETDSKNTVGKAEASSSLATPIASNSSKPDEKSSVAAESMEISPSAQPESDAASESAMPAVEPTSVLTTPDQGSSSLTLSPQMESNVPGARAAAHTQSSSSLSPQVSVATLSLTTPPDASSVETATDSLGNAHQITSAPVASSVLLEGGAATASSTETSPHHASQEPEPEKSVTSVSHAEPVPSSSLATSTAVSSTVSASSTSTTAVASSTPQLPASVSASALASVASAAVGDDGLPEEVDPAFLEALPEDMRAEVLQQFESSRRARQRAQNISQAAATAAAASGTETSGNPMVDPDFIAEFLAAAPPHIAEEVRYIVHAGIMTWIVGIFGLVS